MGAHDAGRHSNDLPRYEREETSAMIRPLKTKGEVAIRPDT